MFGLQSNVTHKLARNLTTFVTADGLYQHVRVPFGLCSALAAFQEMLSEVLAGLPGCRNLMDDIIVFGKDKLEHRQWLTKVLQRLQERGLTLNGDKCLLGQKEVTMYGLQFSASGVRPSKSNVQAVLDIPEPTTAKELVSFLAMTNWHLRFIPDYGEIVAPLRPLVKKDATWSWTRQCAQAFITLKERISTAPVLAHFDCNAETIVTCDASGKSLGAMLSQLDKNGEERAVAFASRGLSPTEQRYSAGEREALACVWSIEKWHLYTYGRKFTLKTDHKALESLLDTGGTGVRPLRIHRWTERLRMYNFKVQYVKGADNSTADLLSRWAAAAPVPGEDSDGDADDTRINAIIQDNLHRLRVITPGELATATSDDKDLAQVVRFVRDGWPTQVPAQLRPWHQVRQELSTWRDGACLARGERAVIPKQLRHRSLKLIHDGHPGIVRCKAIARASVWWPAIDLEIEEMVRGCNSCILSEKGRQPDQPQLQPTPWPTTPWQHLQLDICGPFITAPPHEQLAIMLQDLHSKWTEVCLSAHATTADVIKALGIHFDKFGLPAKVTTDNGPQFAGHEFAQYLEARGIEHAKTSFYHPQANGGIERWNRVFKDGLKTGMADGLSFKEAARKAVAVYRTIPHAATGMSPAELMLGRRIRTTWDVKPHPPNPVRHEVRTALDKYQKRMVDSRATSGTNNIQRGDLVRVRRPQKKHKLATRLGPVRRVNKQVGRDSFRLDDGMRWHTSRLVSVDSDDGQDEQDGAFDKGVGVAAGVRTPPTPPPQPQQLRRSTRQRRRPVRYPDNELPGV